MKAKNRVKILLFIVLLIMAIIPFTGSFLFFNGALETSLNLGFNASLGEALVDGSENLVKLKKLDPSNEKKYREQFEKLERLRMVYSQPESVRRGLSESFRILYLLGLIISVVLAVVIAGVVSTFIARSYQKIFSELENHREKIQYLAGMSSWQQFAQMLAHEIKNPLTPIEVMISSLTSSYKRLPAEKFGEQLIEAERITQEEINNLKSLVRNFSDFSKIGKVRGSPVQWSEFLTKDVQHFSEIFAPHQFHLQVEGAVQHRVVSIDAVLFRHMLKNIVQNAIEANPQKDSLVFNWRLLEDKGQIELQLENDGELIDRAISDKMWEPYFSTKHGKENMGLGLSIVKKIAIEHGGEIEYRDSSGKATFVFTIEGRPL